MVTPAEMAELREEFARRLADPVKIDLFSRRPLPMLVPGRDECVTCPAVLELLQTLASLNPNLRLTVHEVGDARELVQRYEIERVPAIVLRGVLNRPVTLYGYPSGSIAGAMLAVILTLSNNKVDLIRGSLRKQLKRLHDAVQVRLFVADGSDPSLEMMHMLCDFAQACKALKVKVINAEEFPRVAQQYGVTQLPVTVINERYSFAGLLTPEAVAAQIVRGARPGAVLTALGVSGDTTKLGAARSQETVRPSGLILPGR